MAHKVIISGGGTGGHIFPAIAIANALKQLAPDTEILFVGAEGKMEMERVPAAGYEIVGLDIVGINRQSLLKNIALPFKMLKSLWKARKVLKDFKAEVAIGVGGYASGPLLMMANMMGLPTIIQEQNSYAGVTNKKLGAKAKKICVAYEGMDRFFPADRILLTGNPIRKSSVAIENKREEAINAFALDQDKKTILFTGGSLGALTLNDCVKAGIPQFVEAGVQVIWQCGSYYYEKLKAELGDSLPDSIKLMPFLERMDYAYAAADVIVGRAGAGTISELCVIGKPVVLVPSPNVSDDHQTKNALALVSKDAALMVTDGAARVELLPQLLSLIADEAKMQELGDHILTLALPDADVVIAQEVLDLIKK
ncbi:undecaprenyldiphospho-muramoylpentapeptide beta-N-acetylglucosaminyltransferase [Sphingobacterium humi]|uniref:UDP-N-acetylglucosamine--N-acetylmuramyl-(pentapeptide) pyrophosphoryl-undecaprenol N-acetylglucosamine transferase n=1 Tax=Sphingobacterium humi TaxID=1796905 RepID=A0A6N8KZB8_9SPHI|nr:undecaprenyldiphospho-muramoylpentapeptide beta-N-acetylglucosaminyltransferase [Sphingobacterium humi]MVZ61288.1 undecaprenyldiphospho-muramoylpentapeptide beta-N-acetylglucosaminyltransferase [Sphingobacterium humi]